VFEKTSEGWALPSGLEEVAGPSGEPVKELWAAPSGLEEMAGPFRQNLRRIWATPSGLEEVAAPFRQSPTEESGLRPLDLRKWLALPSGALRKNLGCALWT
jgi:hypothetical protein